MIKSDFIIKILFAVEKYILKHANIVSTISPGMIKKVQEKCKKEITYFPNWVDCEQFYPIENKEELKKKFGFDASDTIVLYSGAIGEKQGLEAMISSAQAFSHLQHVKFIICGSGPYKEKLQELNERLGLKNVIFSPLQPKNKFNEFLNIADIHLILQKANASDLVMPSKLSTIFSVGGLALVTASPETSLHSIVVDLEIGVVVEPENQTALNAAILRALTSDNTLTKNKARNFAYSTLSINKVLTKFSKSALTENELTPVFENKSFSKYLAK